MRRVQPTEHFGKVLRAERVSKGLSQEALGASAGLHFTEISRLERAVRDPRLSTIVRLARALELSPAELLRDVT